MPLQQPLQLHPPMSQTFMSQPFRRTAINVNYTDLLTSNKDLQNSTDASCQGIGERVAASMAGTTKNTDDVNVDQDSGSDIL